MFDTTTPSDSLVHVYTLPGPPRLAHWNVTRPLMLELATSGVIIMTPGDTVSIR